MNPDSSTPQFRRFMLELVSQVKASEAWKLKFLHKHLSPSLQDTHLAVLARKRFLKALLPTSEGGMVENYDIGIWSSQHNRYLSHIAPCIAVVWSGRDCDGVQYCNDVSYIDVSSNPKQAVQDHIDSTYTSADGPCSFYLLCPSQAMHLRYSSRDLTLEAFEDGHAHTLSTVRYSDE